MEYKIIGNYLFFLRGWLSQWYKSVFVDKSEIEYVCCEQYMMYQKAMLFNDIEIANRILQSIHPSEHKRLGRMVRGFSQEEWNKNKERIVYEGNFYKFNQNRQLKDFLRKTEPYILAEANGEDMIWGIGMYDDDPNLMKTELWGENLLGKALMRVREEIDK